MKVGITGHQTLAPELSRYAEREMRSLLCGDDQLVGYSSLAEGADQIFAHVVLSLGGSLCVIQPCAEYQTTFGSARSRADYQILLDHADAVETLAFPGPSEDAFLAAGKAIVAHSEWLIAVWDGHPARGLGGTADVVEHARELDRRIDIVWPLGATR